MSEGVRAIVESEERKKREVLVFVVFISFAPPFHFLFRLAEETKIAETRIPSAKNYRLKTIRKSKVVPPP